MTDDIVIRLRGKHGLWFRTVVGVHESIILETIYGEAADEIERLRAMLAHGLVFGSTCEGCDICDQLKRFHEQTIDKIAQKRQTNV